MKVQIVFWCVDGVACFVGWLLWLAVYYCVVEWFNGCELDVCLFYKVTTVVLSYNQCIFVVLTYKNCTFFLLA
jgi:hypothetical protein